MAWEKTMHIKSSIIALLLLSACAGMGDVLAELKSKVLTSDTFPQALASEYRAYAESLVEEGHPLRARHFAKKGLAALAEGDVAPEEKPAFASSRQALVAVLTPDVKEIAPTKAARAQLLFDCWVEKETVCKDSFTLALAELQVIADALVHEGNTRFVAEFAPNSAVLSDSAATTLSIAAKRIAGFGEYQVELQPPPRKGKLATQRVLAVEEGLIKRGVHAGKITVSGKTKNNEVTLSVDKKKQPANSVVILIQTYGPLMGTQPP
jgi:OOP family OmpA-OmpF porin